MNFVWTRLTEWLTTMLVGSIMGKANINISGMVVGKTDKEGTNLMALTLDDDVPADVLKEVTALDGIFGAKMINLNVI